MIINELNAGGSRTLPSHPALRQIDAASGIDATPFWDVNGDGYLSPIDALLVIDRLNAASVTYVDLSDLNLDDPANLDDDAVDQVFDELLDMVGDSNLDGRFSSDDFILAFQMGEYEDGIEDNSQWADGDWDGDRDFTTADLVLAFQQGRYTD